MNAIVVRGTLSDARHIELAEPVQGVAGDIEVTIRKLPSGARNDIFELIAASGPGTRSKADIDGMVHASRAGWQER